MKLKVTSMALATCLISSIAGAGQMPDPYSQPAAAISARQGAHQLMTVTLIDAGKFAGGQKKWNGFTMLNRVDSLAQISEMYNDFFFVPESFAGSNSRDDLLDRKLEFMQLSKELKLATFSLRMAVRNHEGGTAMKAVGETIKACNACHTSFMKPGTEIILPMPVPPAAH